MGGSTRADEFIKPNENDTYHTSILNLLKIENNEILNNHFYKNIPTINKSLLLYTDLSSPNIYVILKKSFY
jgi:hypothetical protein